jgi:hypothetical protein
MPWECTAANTTQPGNPSTYSNPDLSGTCRKYPLTLTASTPPSKAGDFYLWSNKY